MRFLIVLVLFALVAVAYSEEFNCQDDVLYKENDCNICKCGERLMACTLMSCPSQQDEKLKNCEVGTSWTKECNTCWCVAEMGTICETKNC